MPTYELTCTDCGKRYEIFLLRMLKNEDLVCPACGSTSIRRGIGGGVLSSSTKSASSGDAGCAGRSFG
jgi:putative FmdB family regulatory protein